MKKLQKLLVILLITLFFGSDLTYAQSNELDFSETFYRGQVLSVLESGQESSEFIEGIVYYQDLLVNILTGPEADQQIKTRYINPLIKEDPYLLSRGDLVVVAKTSFSGDVKYEIYEPYRLSYLFWILLGFVLLSVAVAGKRGLTALLGLGATLIILIGWMTPALISGNNPFLISVVGVTLMAGFSFYLSHGFKVRTTIALVSTLITLAITALMAYFSVYFSRLLGQGSEEAVSLGLAFSKNFDLRGLLLAAIVIGSLGVLDDITTSQVAIVEQLKKANHKLSSIELYRRAMEVGKTHIASLINTLVIAYVGASLPLFLLFTVSNQPYWVVLNSELVSEEIVRTLVGSSALILSVPITTLMAAYFYAHYQQFVTDEKGHVCGHVH